ncbi:MAG TPA: patatin family protein [Candidatus Dorea intestinavium]|nr:patatin family protein [Candidatus Dorea intestinavium]
MEKATLILEGGASRGLFTSGALDYLMEKELELSHVIGVSMGACNAVDYVSKQIGRTKDCIIQEDEGADFYFGLKDMIKNKSVMDMDMIFEEFPKNQHPFDMETYKNSPISCEVVATNCVTGKAEYLDERQDINRLMKICRASCSMPVVAPITFLDEVPYLDGGVSDPVPLKRAMSYHNKKIVIILTRNANYRKKPHKKPIRKLYKKMYKEYPNLIKTMNNRYRHYNRVMDKIEEYEREGLIFVLRPELPTISHMEKNKEKLHEFYDHGYLLMKENYNNLLDYLTYISKNSPSSKGLIGSL